MFEVFVESHFSAAHRLRDYPGNCAQCHGHNWTVQAVFQTAELSDLGLALDFRVAKACLQKILAALDHKDLNQVPELAGVNPSCEVIARHIYRAIAADANRQKLKVARVTVRETPTAGATYYE
jgi:6-pyruvoyltetrahydropterin/6-carboxytetrahydropterin synthase